MKKSIDKYAIVADNEGRSGGGETLDILKTGRPGGGMRMAGHNIFKGELEEEINACGSARLTLSDYSTIEIGSADNWIGGGDGYMCDMLGNVEYPTIHAVINALYAYLDKIGITVEDMD